MSKDKDIQAAKERAKEVQHTGVAGIAEDRTLRRIAQKEMAKEAVEQ